MTPTEYGALHGVSRQRVVQWINEGRLKAKWEWLNERHGTWEIKPNEPRPKRKKSGPKQREGDG